MAPMALQSPLWKLLYITMTLASHVIADNITNPVSVYESVSEPQRFSCCGESITDRFPRPTET